MKLEVWIREDMRKYIREAASGTTQEPKKLRREDTAYLYQMRYMEHIQKSLKKGKLSEAKREFNRLKQHYSKIPEEYSAEKQSLYRVMEDAYKLIYDYVAEQEKTQRVLKALKFNTDVFDETVRPTQLADDVKKKKKEQEEQEQETQSMMAQAIRAASVAMQPQYVAPAQHAPQAWQPLQPLPSTPPPQPVAQPVNLPPQPPAPKPIVVQHAPQPVPPAPEPTWDLAPEEETPPIVFDEKAMMLQAAKELIHESQTFLEQQQIVPAQEKLIEAKFEIDRAGGDRKLSQEVDMLERQIASMLATTPVAAEDRELFSSLYLRGLQALQNRDYSAAYKLFLQRINQSPHDLAARIRLEECREVIYGNST